MTTTNTVVETTHGPVRGVDHGYVKVWKGIRYAAPPVRDLRWRAPQPPKRWTTIADASRFAPVCPQPPVPAIPFDLGVPQSEDRLSLNIWVPALPGNRKPVLRTSSAPEASRSTTAAFSRQAGTRSS